MEKQHESRKAEAYELLTTYSREVSPLVEAGEYENVNSAIKEIIYKPQGHVGLRKFREWKEADFRILKGEKGLPLWARPLRVLKEEKRKPDEPQEVNEGPDFYPIVYLFSQKQVEPRRAA